MGHTEVTETPCQSRCNGKCAVAACFAGRNAVSLKEVKKAGESLNVIDNVTEAVSNSLTEAENNEESDSHNDTLNEVCGGSREESAQCTVSYDDHCADDHSKHIVHTEEG